jgi:hypothetical protein
VSVHAENNLLVGRPPNRGSFKLRGSDEALQMPDVVGEDRFRNIYLDVVLGHREPSFPPAGHRPVSRPFRQAVVNSAVTSSRLLRIPEARPECPAPKQKKKG